MGNTLSICAAVFSICILLTGTIAPSVLIQEVEAKTSKWHNVPKICGDKICDSSNSNESEDEREKTRMNYAKESVAKAAIEEEMEEVMAEPAKVAKPEEPKTKSVPVSLLFVQMATSGTFTPTDDGHLLVFEGINPQTLYFSDRPDRITGHMTTDNYVNNWGTEDDSFESDPPNAAITILGADETEDTIIVELTNPVYDSEMMTLQYTAQILEDASDGISHYAEHVDESLPESFGHVAVFIDASAPEFLVLN